jgi:hypothetical protein
MHRGATLVFPLISPRETVDKKEGGIEKAMREQGDGEAAMQLERPTGWFNWAKRHPGVVLLGALLMAILALPKSPRIEDIELDTSVEDVPLFI